MMSSTAPLVLVISFWLLVYIRRRYVLSNTQSSVLPVTASFNPRRVSRVLWTLGDYAEIDLTSPFVLRGRTFLFIDNHGGLLEFLGRSSESTPRSRTRPAKSTSCRWDWGSIVKAFYTLGSVTAIVGQTLAFGVLCWSLLQLGLRLLSSSDSSTTITHKIMKRGPVPMTQSLNHYPKTFLLRPLIPGINLPLYHLLPVFLSLIVCTTIHELGHAIAAAADGVPLLSWGYSLILAIPAAFVELATPISTNKERTPLARLRITSAGVYHNLITILILFVLSTISFDRMIWPLFGFRDVEIGVVVIDVAMASPLRPHLIPGSVITRINDASLSESSNHTPQDRWSSLLLMDTVEHEEGWCVERHWFEDHSQSCCLHFPSHTDHENVSCFIPRSSSLTALRHGWCLDPVSLFEDHTKQRCLSHVDCNATSVSDMFIAEKTQAETCIIPHSSSELLRISFLKNADDDVQRLIVWKGPKREVWEQVTVGKYLPRLRILSLTLPGVIGLIVEYLRTVSLSLFFFNLLPIRFLDGGEILGAFLELILTMRFPLENQSMPLRHGDIDIEMGAREWGNHFSTWRLRTKNIQRLVETMTVFLIGVVSIGGLLVSESGVG